MYVLDTNIISELRKVKTARANPGLVGWAQEVKTALTYLSAITIQELEHGVLLAERSDPPAGKVLRHWIDNDVLRSFARRILPIDAQVAKQAAALHVPDPAPVQDALIAATALTNDMAVVTRNTRDFERFPNLVVINPFN